MIALAKAELRTLILAIQFLTRLPIPDKSAYSPDRFHASVRYYPLVGALIGCIAALVYIVSALFWPPLIAVLLSTAASIMVTGGFHEDGLADMFDGVGGGTTARDVLEIMKDSRIGTFGLLAVLVVLAIKVTALALFGEATVIIALIAAHGISRLSSVMVIASSSYARLDGTSKPVATEIRGIGLAFAIATGALCCVMIYFLLSPPTALAVAIGALAGHVIARLIFETKIGGYTGDCLGATQQLSEVGMYLGILACQ